MDDDDIQGKISRHRANMEALANADADCILELQSLCQTLLDINAKVAETSLLYPPRIYEREGKARPELSLGDDGNWHSDFAPRLYCGGVNAQFTFNPTAQSWAVRVGSSRKKIDTSQITNLYTSLLAEWVFREYPAEKERLEERKRIEASERKYWETYRAEQHERDLKWARDRAESKARMDEYTRPVGIVLNGCLVLAIFFVVSAIIAAVM